MIWNAVAAFVAMTVLDFVWARYNVACAEKKAMLSGVYAVAIMLLGAQVILTYVDDPWMLLPAAAGAFAGTVSSIWLAKDRRPKADI